jgi:GNAT superfamily N-acetyltransferase
MPQIDPHLPMYRQLEAAGVLHAFGAFSGDELVGFLLMIVSPVPHYSAVVANTESFFVKDGHRKGGTGVRLLKMAEEHAKNLGAVGVFVSAPSGGRLSRAMPLLGFRETNRVFFRKLT